MDALKEIEAAWMEWSGYYTAPPGGGPALEKWEVFKAAWVAAKANGEIQRERLEHLRDVEADRDRYRDERNELSGQLQAIIAPAEVGGGIVAHLTAERDEARKLADALVESGDPKPWKINDWHAAKEKCAAWKIGDWGFRLGEEYPK